MKIFDADRIDTGKPVRTNSILDEEHEERIRFLSGRIGKCGGLDEYNKLRRMIFDMAVQAALSGSVDEVNEVMKLVFGVPSLSRQLSIFFTKAGFNLTDFSALRSCGASGMQEKEECAALIECGELTPDNCAEDILVDIQSCLDDHLMFLGFLVERKLLLTRFLFSMITELFNNEIKDNRLQVTLDDDCMETIDSLNETNIDPYELSDFLDEYHGRYYNYTPAIKYPMDVAPDDACLKACLTFKDPDHHSVLYLNRFDLSYALARLFPRTGPMDLTLGFGRSRYRKPETRKGRIRLIEGDGDFFAFEGRVTLERTSGEAVTLGFPRLLHFAGADAIRSLYGLKPPKIEDIVLKNAPAFWTAGEDVIAQVLSEALAPLHDFFEKNRIPCTFDPEMLVLRGRPAYDPKLDEAASAELKVFDAEERLARLARCMSAMSASGGLPDADAPSREEAMAHRLPGSAFTSRRQ